VRDDVALPVAVQEGPHWRVNIRPDEYREDRIPSLAECYQIIERTKVSLRGWDYPHLSHREEETGTGPNWVASWSEFGGHREYWRLYQSGQFLHLFSMREALEPHWRRELENSWQAAHDSTAERPQPRGFISLVNLLWTVTEVFEFAARLCEVGLYDRLVTIRIDIKGIEGFRLAETGRAWYRDYAAHVDELGRAWELNASDLLAASAEHSLKATAWYLERFGWLSPSFEVLREDQQKLLQSRS
jgi:hypothetical protein